jgi:hypothetical protein
MLKWAMRIVAVGGALLAMAVVGSAAWMHRTQGWVWLAATPAVCSDIVVSPQYVSVDSWLRREDDPGEDWDVGRYGLNWQPWHNDETEPYFKVQMQSASVSREWNDFGILYGGFSGSKPIPSLTEAICPTWAVIAVLLLPTGLWAGVGWRQRRRTAAGHCANCGYDLRATPEKCPECGRAV